MTQPFALPAEFHEHRATVICWPYREEIWDSRTLVIGWCFAEAIRTLSKYEPVVIACISQELVDGVRQLLLEVCPTLKNIECIVLDYENCWVRDTAPISLLDEQSSNCVFLPSNFNGWGRAETPETPDRLAESLARHFGLMLLPRPLDEGGSAVVMEGGAFDCDGEGTLLVTEECFIAGEKARGERFTKDQWEVIFARYLGVKKTIWLKIEACFPNRETVAFIQEIWCLVAALLSDLVADGFQN